MFDDDCRSLNSIERYFVLCFAVDVMLNAVAATSIVFIVTAIIVMIVIAIFYVR